MCGFEARHKMTKLNSMRHNLSEVTELIRDRRSISPDRFSNRRVHREIVELALTNATWAPTHGMTQPWRFKAFVGDGMKQVGPQLAMWYKACAGDAYSQSKYDNLQRRGENVTAMVSIGMVPDATGRISIQDERMAVACAVQNIYLTCTAHGVGGFWSTPDFLQMPEVKAFMGLPLEGELLGLFYMGYPADSWPQSHRKPLEYVTEWVDA